MIWRNQVVTKPVNGKKGGPRFDSRPGTLRGKISLSYTEEINKHFVGRGPVSPGYKNNLFITVSMITKKVDVIPVVDLQIGSIQNYQPIVLK
jgi:hypothetical protein